MITLTSNRDRTGDLTRVKGDDNHYTKDQQNDFSVPLQQNGSERNSYSLLLYFFHGTEFRVVYSAAAGFGREFWEYASIFASMERNSKLFSLALKCSEGNSESSLLFVFNGTEFRVVFSSAEGFGKELRGFLFRGTAGIPSEITICSVYSVFRGIIFCRKFPTLILIMKSVSRCLGGRNFSRFKKWWIRF